MTRTKRWTWSTLMVSVGLFCSFLLLHGCGTSRAQGVQVDGRLAPCPTSPNCVCSQATDPDHVVAAISYQGERDDAHRRLLIALASLPRTTVISEDQLTATTTYLHLTATTLIMRFTDDIELLIDDTSKHIEIRSLSRIGYSDFGVNRRRVEAIRQAFAATP
jgi:uncharacterized protein (DUF1499 family)